MQNFIISCEKGNKEIVELLLKSGVDFELKDKFY